MKSAVTTKNIYISPECWVFETESSRVLCTSINVEGYNSGQNAWTENDGEDENFFND